MWYVTSISFSLRGIELYARDELVVHRESLTFKDVGEHHAHMILAVCVITLSLGWISCRLLGT